MLMKKKFMLYESEMYRSWYSLVSTLVDVAELANQLSKNGVLWRLSSWDMHLRHPVLAKFLGYASKTDGMHVQGIRGVSLLGFQDWVSRMRIRGTRSASLARIFKIELSSHSSKVSEVQILTRFLRSSSWNMHLRHPRCKSLVDSQDQALEICIRSIRATSPRQAPETKLLECTTTLTCPDYDRCQTLVSRCKDSSVKCQVFINYRRRIAKTLALSPFFLRKHEHKLSFSLYIYMSIFYVECRKIITCERGDEPFSPL